VDKDRCNQLYLRIISSPYLILSEQNLFHTMNLCVNNKNPYNPLRIRTLTFWSAKKTE